MKFSWEKIHVQKDDFFWFATYRAKVIGGWLVRSFDLTKQPLVEGAKETNLSTSESCVFVSDQNHLWEVDNG